MIKILIIRCGALGDLVYSTSVIEAMKLQFGDNTIIDFITTPIGKGLLINDKRVNKIFILKHKKIPIFLSTIKKEIIKYSKQLHYDYLISLESGKQFISLIKHIEAKHKIGMGLENISLPENTNRAYLTKLYYKSILKDYFFEKAKPKIYGSNISKYNLESNFIVIAPSNSHNKKSGINYRSWRFDYWKELIQKLSKEYNLVILGAKGEEDFFNHIKPYPTNVTDLVGHLNIGELVSVVKNAKASICTDSAIGHISAAVNTPVFVLMGPNSTIVDIPFSTKENKIIPISLHLACSPCYKTIRMKQCKNNICMGNITPEMILDTLQSHKIIKNIY
ncbi:MAG: glycosyltransferase family 9 protein [Sulfurovum sp.]|nr:MAG: glycosyltransferase family 9 protein [Sulfurovum sp.]